MNRLVLVLAGLLLLLALPVPAALAGPVDWQEVAATPDGRQWWDSGSLRISRNGSATSRWTRSEDCVMGATPPPVLDIGVAADGSSLGQLAAMLNRHGLVTGATGTGKTVTLQVLAEGLSRLGVPVFAADIKGDLSGIADAGRLTPKFEERLHALGLEVPAFEGTPVTLWDLFGETGIPVRMTVSEMGPLLLARLLDLNDTQTGVLYATFRIADDNGLLLLDLPDLRAMLAWVGTNAASLKLEYGNLPATSIAAIQRSLLVLEEQGANAVFGEPALALTDLIATAADIDAITSAIDAALTKVFS
jgi:hypothetical protein